MKQRFNVWFVVLLFVLSFSTISAQKANPESDFNYDLNGAGTGVFIQSYKGKATNVVIPSVIEDFPVVELEEGAFYGTNVESVVIPDSITKLGSGVFRDCEYLKKVTLPKSLNSIPESFFSRCFALKEITLPKDLKTTGRWSFSECTALKEITLPEGLKIIERETFESSGLESITVPASVVKIDEGAFKFCEALKEVTLSEGLKIIGYCAFLSSGLESITLPDSVVYISDRAFSGCINLKTVIIGSGIKGIGQEAFKNCSSLTTFNIGVEKLEKKVDEWGKAMPIEGYEYGDYGYDDNYFMEGIFSGCSSLSLKEKKKIRDTGYKGSF